MRIRFRNLFTTSCYGSYGKCEISEGQISIVRKSYRKLKCNYSDEFEKIVRKATVALENKICEQNITPCCERHAISCETAFTRCFHPQTATRGISKCSRLTKMYGAKKFGMIPALSRLR